MNKNIAFLELKYGNIYGGFPNFYAISEVSLLVFEPGSNKIFIETIKNNTDIDVVYVYSRADELGNTIAKEREVFNMYTGERRSFNEEYRLEKEQIDEIIDKLRFFRRNLANFLNNAFRKYGVRNVLHFDGRRDLFLCQKAGANMRNLNPIDLQKEITKETKYLFSLNKLGKVIGFQAGEGFLKSNNLEYRLHPIASSQIVEDSAAFDAARLLMVNQEYRLFKEDFMVKAQLLLNKIELQKKD